MVLDLIDSLSKEDWDGICNVIETTGKAATGVLAAYGTVVAAEALLEKAKAKPKEQTVDNIDPRELLRLRIEEATSHHDDLVEAFTQGKVSKDLVNTINNK